MKRLALYLAPLTVALFPAYTSAQFFALPVHVEEGGGSGPDGTTHYFEVTIQSSQIDSTLTNFPVYVDLSDAPAGFWTQVNAGGANIRVYDSTGSTEMPREVVHIDTSGGDTGELHFEANSLSSSSNTTFRIYYGGSASAPATSDSNGRDAVWDNSFASVIHFSETDPSSDTIVNSEGTTGLDMLDNAMESTDDVAGLWGATGEPSAFDFGGTDEYVVATQSAFSAYSFTISALANTDNVAANIDLVSVTDFDTSDVLTRLQIRANVDDAVRVIFNQGGTSKNTTGSTDVVDGGYHHIAVVVDSGNVTGYADGSADGTNTHSQSWSAGNDRSVIGGRLNSSTFSNPFEGVVDEVRFHTVARSAAWLSAEDSNWITPNTFYSVGSEVAL